MNILILGGNGYIGSKVTRELVKKGNLVVCTKRPYSDMSRLTDVLEKIKLIPASIDSVETAMSFNRFDYVLNMVCNYGKNGSLYDNVLQANLEFPLKVLNSAVFHGVKNFLSIGTGLPDNFNMYSYTKKLFSDFGRFYSEKHGINFQNLLLEMFYGPDEPSNRFLPSVIKKMLMNEDVFTTVGTQHRDIICSDDVVRAIMIVMDSNLKDYTEVPVGTGESPTISEIIDYIWLQTEKKSVIHKGAIPMRNDEPNCVADISKLSALAQWSPVSWKDGLKCMIYSMKNFLENKNV